MSEGRIVSLAAKIDDLPTHRWKTPLQQGVQFLKRHRDVMFEKNSEVKPISVILTTLAGRAYKGESDIYETLKGILSRMEGFIQPFSPRIANPVNPKEDFADKWNTRKGRELGLERNFRLWVRQAKSDLELLGQTNADRLIEQAHDKFKVGLPLNDIRRFPGIETESNRPKMVNITTSAKPWRR